MQWTFDLQQLNVDDLDAYHADIIQKWIVHIFKAAGVTNEVRLSPHSLSAMSAQLDNTLVWIAFDNPYVLTIFSVIDMVQLSSVWLSQQCTFFICLFPLVALIDFCSLYGGTWGTVLREYVLIRSISSFLRPGLVLLHTSE